MNNLKNIIFKELRELFRDKKSLAMMLIAPLLIPAIIFGMSAIFESTANKSISEYNKIGFNYELSDVEKAIAKELQIEVVEKNEEELKSDYKNGDIFLYVVKNENNYELNGDNTENTNYAIGLANTFYSTYKNYLQADYLAQNNINPQDIVSIITISENISEKDNFMVSYITSYGFLFVIMAITMAAIYPATDAIAGEKERGTLETLLTFPIRNKDIIIGKFLSVSCAAAFTGIIGFIFMNVSLYMANGMFDIYKEITITLSMGTIIYSVIAVIAYSLLISGLAISIASKTKTYKEAQSALTPLSFLAIFPGMITFFTNLETTALLSAIPFINITLLFGDCVKGSFNWLNIGIMFVSTIIFIAIVLKVIIKQYKSEKVLF